MQKTKVILISHSVESSTTLSILLENYDVRAIDDSNNAIKEIADHGARLLVIDLTNLIDAPVVIRKYRNLLSIPILVVLSEATNKLQDVINTSFKCGADNVITLPIAMPIFEAKVEALLRMVLLSGSEPLNYANVFDLGPFTFCYSDQELCYKHSLSDNQNVTKKHITKKEAGLLFLFLSNVDRVLTNEAIVLNVWGSDYADNFSIRSMNVYIVRVRKLLKDSDYSITNIHGRGYKMVFNK